MNILSRPIRWNSRGYALIIIMCFLTASLLVFVSVMYWITGSARVTASNNQFNMSEAAAEAASEKVLSKMNYDFVAQSLTNGGAYYSKLIPTTNINQQANWLINDQANWPIKYVYSATNGAVDQISVNLGVWTTNTVPLHSQYTGLYGLVQECTITATATPIDQRFNVPATVKESIQFASIPLFQFAVFYNMDLEIDPGQDMTIKGAVWSNGGIWTGSTLLTLSNMVSAVGIATNCIPDPFCKNSQYNGDGKSTYILAGQPTSGNDRITMPIGTNNDPAAVHAIIDIPPAAYAMNSADAFTTNGQLYLANSADLYLTNFPSGTNWGSLRPNCTNTNYFQSNACMILYYQDGTFSPYQTQIPYDFYLLKTNYGAVSTWWTNYVVTNGTYWPNTNAHFNCISNVQYAGYSFLTNDIFSDWREGWNSGSPKTVQAVQIDIQKFNIWLTNAVATNSGLTYNTTCQNHKAHPIDSIYVYNAVRLTSTTLPAVRVANGAKLPSQTLGKGFTVATAMPMYVWGNYNSANDSGSSLGQNSTTYTWPAALMADSITILSTNWDDGNTAKNPTPKTTTVNAAMLEGIVRSTTNSGAYSGGLENFIRLLENWSGVPLWYNGSIVVMFPSQYATNYWNYGNYYTAPTRNWAFDTNFTQQAGLPPLTPQAKGVVRKDWTAY
jgi:hypothetical protein